MKLPARTALVFACGAMLAADSYRAQIEQWRQQRLTALQADGGWLTVAGLFWLHEGSNSFGAGPSYDIDLKAEPPVTGSGSFELQHGKVTLHMNVQTRDLRLDSGDVVNVGRLSMFAIQRGDRYGIRLKDPDSRMRKEFTGLHYFPVNEAYRIRTRLVPDPKKIPILNILGQVQDTPSPGYVEFEISGRKVRLTPVEESPGELSFIFRDLTSGKETYGSGRFLDTPLGKDGEVDLDFNKAYNPPCAFTPYATCPLPPKENRLAVRIEAGELKYGSH
jgi:hypothetical protein